MASPTTHAAEMLKRTQLAIPDLRKSAGKWILAHELQVDARSFHEDESERKNSSPNRRERAHIINSTDDNEEKFEDEVGLHLFSYIEVGDQVCPPKDARREM